MAPIVNTTSTAGTALAGITASVDIPKPRDTGFWTGRDTFAAVTARAAPSKIQPIELPTPPNSISPSIPPMSFCSRTLVAPSTPPSRTLGASSSPPAAIPVDSDLDLQDAVDHTNAQDVPHHVSTIGRGLNSLADLGTTGTITPVLLARHHLPGILLENGPLPIRHVMAYLTTSVPGFLRIPPARARRLVVSALEQGGAGDDVIFEKVGWGKWNAVRREQTTRDIQPAQPHRNTQATNRLSMDQPRTSQIADNTRRPVRSPNSASGMSIPGKSVRPSRGFRREYSDHDAEKMSLDGDTTGSSPTTLEDEPMLDHENGDSTEEEDWASIGAAALRAGVFPRSSVHPRSYHPYPNPSHQSRNARNRGAGPPSSILPTSTSRPNSPYVHYPPHQPRTSPSQLDFPASPLPGSGLYGNNSQEREAIEALVKLKNV